MTKTLKNGLIAVAVPGNASIFEMAQPFVLSYYISDKKHTQTIMHNSFKGFEILGYVTESSIDFFPHLISDEFVPISFWKNKEYSNDKSKSIAAFRSMLTAEDVLFSNPYGDRPNSFNAAQWQTAQRKVVEKVVILKPITV